MAYRCPLGLHQGHQHRNSQLKSPHRTFSCFVPTLGLLSAKPWYKRFQNAQVYCNQVLKGAAKTQKASKPLWPDRALQAFSVLSIVRQSQVQNTPVDKILLQIKYSPKASVSRHEKGGPSQVSLICPPLSNRLMSYTMEGLMWFLCDSGSNADMNQISGLQPQSCH